MSTRDEDEAARTGVALLERSRSLTRVIGADAFDLLQSLLSCDVALASDTHVVYGLVLTPKARIVADVRVLRADAESFLIDAAVAAGPLVERTLLRYRLARRVTIEADATLGLASVMGPRVWSALPGAAALEGLQEDRAIRIAGAWLIATAVFGVPAVDVLAPPAELRRLCEATGGSAISPPVADALRIEAGVPRYGTELDDRVMPAEAGVVDRAVSFTKGCYPGQEPVTRLAHRGHANRGLRRFSGQAEVGGEIVHEGRVVGRVTSVATSPRLGPIGLAYVRVDVPGRARARVGESEVDLLD